MLNQNNICILSFVIWCQNKTTALFQNFSFVSTLDEIEAKKMNQLVIGYYANWMLNIVQHPISNVQLFKTPWSVERWLKKIFPVKKNDLQWSFLLLLMNCAVLSSSMIRQIRLSPFKKRFSFLKLMNSFNFTKSTVQQKAKLNTKISFAQLERRMSLNRATFEKFKNIEFSCPDK